MFSYTFVYAVLSFFVSYVSSQTLFEDASTVEFSGSDFASSTGWVYTFTTDATEQWGRLYYKMDPMDTSSGGVAHVTFVQITNGIGTYSTDADNPETQAMRIVDSVGNTLKMEETPSLSMQYLLNIDTPSSGELNRDTHYIYYYNTNWTCMEWYTNYDTQQIELYEDTILTYEVDNDLTFTITDGTVTFTIPESLDLQVGMYTYNGISVSGAFKDVQVSTTRIGCDGSTSTGGTGDDDDDDDGSSGSANTANTDDDTTITIFGDTTNTIEWVVLICIVLFIAIFTCCSVLQKMGYIICTEKSIEWVGGK